MKRYRTIHPKRTNRPDVRNVDRGRAALKAMIDDIDLLEQKKPAITPASTPVRPTPLIDKILSDIEKGKK
ncbi:MAG: hypothetical protein U1E51_27265 [Candidatus Binatia bacterium]|nr:hypothetical protein [Candidatus Binatia bacterium]